MVGGFNTAFALALYAFCVCSLYSRGLPSQSTWPTRPIWRHVTSTKPLGITVAFLCYKHFVFRTKGNYLKEWLRCFAVYGSEQLS